ncbi:MAG: thymidine kinase [Elusimicrobia bacterium GWC2_65_9]|nr:MAG: thymidine kinase [Elusimicrobia bacterium GWA2_66_18]OGR72754.1 MAG: thymidine kinase [Elusimicrobia bacterium GWC2_65_9]
MFSGKTQELIRRLRLAQIARQSVQVFNSSLDVRYAKDHIVSHDLTKTPSIAVARSCDILKRIARDTQVVGIDEVQFFDDEVVEVCEKMANEGRRVIVAGLDQDFRGVPFPVTSRLMGVAEFVTKNLAICMVCGNPANRSQRLGGGRKVVDVGASDKYEARCRRCFRR